LTDPKTGVTVKGTGSNTDSALRRATQKLAEKTRAHYEAEHQQALVTHANEIKLTQAKIDAQYAEDMSKYQQLTTETSAHNQQIRETQAKLESQHAEAMTKHQQLEQELNARNAEMQQQAALQAEQLAIKDRIKTDAKYGAYLGGAIAGGTAVYNLIRDEKTQRENDTTTKKIKYVVKGGAEGAVKGGLVAGVCSLAKVSSTLIAKTSVASLPIIGTTCVTAVDLAIDAAQGKSIDVKQTVKSFTKNSLVGVGVAACVGVTGFVSLPAILTVSLVSGVGISSVMEKFNFLS